MATGDTLIVRQLIGPRQHRPVAERKDADNPLLIVDAEQEQVVADKLHADRVVAVGVLRRDRAAVRERSQGLNRGERPPLPPLGGLRRLLLDR